MKHLFISTVLTVMSVFSFAANASVQNYKGTLSNVTMNGKSYNNATNQSFTLISTGGNLYDLAGTVGPIGKMPGTIKVELKVSINNGVVTATTPIGGYAGKLMLLDGGLPIKIKLSSFTGSLVNNELHFVLDTYAGWQSVPVFPASVTFDGNF